MSEFLPPSLEQTIAYLEDEVQRSRLDHQSSEATLAMAVARLGGIVEGAPTHRINFLQRIDALREIERQHGELADALGALLAGFTGDDVRLLAVTAFGSKVGPEIHEKCDRMGLAREQARAALAKAGRLP